ncbi:MAG: hypothetical protein RQ966_09420 [Acetobacteraceae bacterium]|nr:hypothetical protein [Acetobacteraceae bacterium]
MHEKRDTVHAGLTAILVWLALYFELHGSLLSTDISFKYMELFASQRVWAVFFLAAANIGIVGLIAHSPVVRLASVLVVATTHGIFAGCLILAGASVWSGTYAIIAGMGYLLAFRRARIGL